MKSLLLFLLLVAEAHAYICVDEDQPAKLAQEVLGILPANECAPTNDAILKQVEDEYKKFYGAEPQVKKSVKGFSLKASAKEIKLASTILGEKPPTGWSAAAAGCETVQCAFEKLLKSKEAAMQLFNIPAKSGYHLSLDQKINPNNVEQMWSAKEIRELDASISKMPPELKHLPHMEKIQRLADGYRRGSHSANTAAFASPRIKFYKEAELVMYDAALNNFAGENPYLTTSWPQEVLIHEMCHHHDYKGYYTSKDMKMTTEQKNAAFSQLSGWQKTTGPKGEDTWKSSPNAKFVSDYASTQPAEDYAETCANYILKPEKLMEKAPEKYAFMKKNIFNNKEFNNAPWTPNAAKSWAPLAALLQDDKDCESQIAECVKSVRFENGNFSKTFKDSKNSVSKISTKSATRLMENDSCVEKFREEKVKKMHELLSKEPSFCDKNGPQLVRGSKNSICAQNLNHLTTYLDKAAKLDTKIDVDKCEGLRDYSIECVKTGLLKALNPPSGILPTLNPIIDSIVPDRMASLSKVLNDMNTSQWLKPCLSATSNIDKYQSTTADGKKSDIYHYNSKAKEFSGGFLSQKVHAGFERQDISMACSKEMLKSLNAQGYKASSEITTGLLSETVRKEIISYETEVIGKMGDALKGCVMASCKQKKALEVLTAWEKLDPAKRSGFATQDHAKELLGKLK